MNAGELAEQIRSAVRESIGTGNQAGLLFSGGVDSTCLAVAARKHADVTLYVLGAPGSHDLSRGKEVANTLDLPVVEVEVTKENILASLEDLVRSHGLTVPRWATTFIGFNILVPQVKELLVMSGQGADELFGGYRKYNEMDRSEAAAQMRNDLEELRYDEAPLYERITASRGKRLAVPFLREELVGFAADIPFEQKLAVDRNKAILRDAAVILGVPKAVAERPKKAMQYGSGISRILKAYLKEGSRTLDDLMGEYKT